MSGITVAAAQAGFFGSAVTSERFWILAACCLGVPEARPPYLEVGSPLDKPSWHMELAWRRQQAERLEREERD